MRLRTLSFLTVFLILLFIITASQILAVVKENGDEPGKGLLAPPAILAPDEREEFRDRHKITFMWNWSPDAAAYHIILARDRAFKNVTYENHKITATSYDIDNLGYGTYFFKVSSVSSDGKEGPFSEARTFIIVPPPPVKVR